ncbi:sperm-associated antigen 5 [Mobula hypostoma]|uniref:sperm-associated antigen 5 n=1 Tax=Mobula hypostoma TaxID=723540 RepID=UPI002FC2811B
MFGQRQSVERDDQRPSTPSRKCGRVPLQELAPQCSVQRDVRSCGRAASGLTPLLRGLRLEEGFLPVSRLVYEDLCRNIFVEEEEEEEEEVVCTPWVRDRVPLVPPTAGGFSDTSSLPTGTPEPTASEGPSSPQVNHGDLPRGTCSNAVRMVVTETREDPEPSVIVAGSVELGQQGPETAVTVAAGLKAGSPAIPAGGASLPQSGSGPEHVRDGTEEASLEPLALRPPDHPALPSCSESVRVRGDGEASPASKEGVRLGKRKRLCTAGEGEGLNADEGGQCVPLPTGGEQLPIAGEWEQPRMSDQEAGVPSGDGAAWPQDEARAEIQGNPEAILAVHTGADSPPLCVSGPSDLEQPRTERRWQPALALAPVEGRVPVLADECEEQLGRAQAEEEGEGQVLEIEDDEGRAEDEDKGLEKEEGRVEEGEAQVEAGTGRVLDEGSVQTEEVEEQKTETGTVQTEEVEMGTVQTEEVEMGTVQTKEVQRGTVQTEEVQRGTVQTEEVETGTVQTEEVQRGTVQTEEVEERAEPAVEVQTEEAVDRAELGTSPLPPPASCALTCLIHPASARTPADTWKLLAQLGTRRVTCRDVSTGITPLGSHCIATCMTPVSLADSDVNTSAVEDSGGSTTDSAVLTDSLLWNINLENLQTMPRGELERRLETTLLITEVLSSQLSDLSRSKGLQRGVGPADQREAFTQTTCTQAPEVEEHYRQLYLEQASRLLELELGLQQCQQLRSAIITFQHQQNSLQDEVEDSLSAADTACEEMQRERERMFEQLQDARQLARESTQALRVMARAVSEAREEAAALKSQAAEAEWSRVNMHQELENSMERLREVLGTVKQVTAEKQQLSSGLAALTKELVEVEQDRDRLMKESSRYFVELATAEAALKLSEAARAKREERLQASEERNKEIDSLQGTVQSLKEAADGLRREKECVEGALTEAQDRVLSLTQSLHSRNEELQDLSDIRAQAALISDNCEFLEQELRICREQLSETEGQLSEQMRILHSRNLQCEELRAQRDHLQSELDAVKMDAREMLLEMGEQMSQTTVSIIDMEGQMQAASRTAETYLKIWQQDLSRMVGEDKAEPQASDLQSDQQAEEEAQSCPGPEHQGTPRHDLRSEQSAFAPIEPACTDTAGGEDTLLVRVTRARAALGRLLDVQTQAESALQQQVKALRQEIIDGRQQQKARSSQKQLELHGLQDRVAKLETENRQLARDLQAHIKIKCDMEETLTDQKQTIVKFHEMLDSNLEEHTQYLAMEQEVVDLRRQLQQLETETSTLREEFAKLQSPADVPGKGWLQEKVELQHQVRKLRGAYVQKDSEMQQLREKMIRHRAILEENNEKAEAEVAKLDQMIEHVRNTLHSVPEVVASSVELKGLLSYLGDDLGT